MERNIPLTNATWFQTGGPARFFSEPTTTDEFKEAIQHSVAQDLPLFVLGSGSNILISDAGFDGVVIRPALSPLSITTLDSNTAQVTAGAGIAIHDCIEYCLAHNVSGLEVFSGIPGTIGGSVYINVHYFEHCLSDFLVRAEVINKETGVVSTVNKDWFDFRYDQSRLFQKDYFLTSATFKLKRLNDHDTAFALGRRHEIIRHRNRRYPTSHTCGSFFRNFHDHEVTLECNGKKMIYAAYYLDKVGIKGELSVGDAIVSHQHANMIVNRGNASSNDIIMLARAMQERVYEKFGVMLRPECQLIGFSKYPLLDKDPLDKDSLTEGSLDKQSSNRQHLDEQKDVTHIL